MYFSSVLQNTFAHPLDDARQFVATDMRVRFIEHRVGRTEIMEQLHHPLHVAAFLGAREEFSVREGSRSAFAETIV